MIEKELIIIGAGPSGINCGIQATKAKLDYLILEKGVLVNSLFHFPSNMTFFSTSVNLEIGNIPFISHTDKPTRKEALEYYRRLMEHYNLQVAFRRKAIKMESKDGSYIITTDKELYKAKYVIVCTGFYDHPIKMNVQGEDLPKVKHYYDEAHHYIGQKIIVVGGANSACDVALETWQKGAQVTMVVRKPQLYEKVKYWILPNIKNRIAEGSISAYFNSEIKEITEDKVVVQTPDGELVLDNDYVLAMTGYQPNYELLSALNIEIESDEFQTPKYDPNTFESNLANVFLAGTLLGGKHTSKFFIENTRQQATQIFNAINSRRSS